LLRLVKQQLPYEDSQGSLMWTAKANGLSHIFFGSTIEPLVGDMTYDRLLEKMVMQTGIRNQRSSSSDRVPSRRRARFSVSPPSPVTN